MCSTHRILLGHIVLDSTSYVILSIFIVFKYRFPNMHVPHLKYTKYCIYVTNYYCCNKYGHGLPPSLKERIPTATVVGVGIGWWDYRIEENVRYYSPM